MSRRHMKAGRREAMRRYHTELADEAMAAWRGRGLRAFLDAIRPTVTASLDAQHGDAPYEIDEDGIAASVTCPACPVQIEGTADGACFYFRERGGWTFGIGATPDDAVKVSMGWRDAEGFRREGDDGDGWMPHAEAWEIVRQCVREWRAERVLPLPAPVCPSPTEGP